MLYRLTIRKNLRTNQRQYEITQTNRKDLQMTRQAFTVVYDGISLPALLNHLKVSL